MTQTGTFFSAGTYYESLSCDFVVVAKIELFYMVSVGPKNTWLNINGLLLDYWIFIVR